MSDLFDGHMTIGEIIRRALEHRMGICKKQDPYKAVGSLIGVDDRTVRRWANDEAKPTAQQFGLVMLNCLYPQGLDEFKAIIFPQLKG